MEPPTWSYRVRRRQSLFLAIRSEDAQLQEFEKVLEALRCFGCYDRGYHLCSKYLTVSYQMDPCQAKRFLQAVFFILRLWLFTVSSGTHSITYYIQRPAVITFCSVPHPTLYSCLLEKSSTCSILPVSEHLFNYPSIWMHVFGLWEEDRVPEENPHRHGENMQTPHRRLKSRTI